MLRGLVLSGLVTLGLLLGGASPAVAEVDRARVAAFLTVTGFDAAVDSLGQSAAMAPVLLGREPDAFGADWERLVAEVFAPAAMLDEATDILAQTLDDDMLTHAAEFYAGSLGQRLVVAENAAHRTPEADKSSAAAAALAGATPERVALLRRMLAALDATGTGIRALEEIQIRFLETADAAGVIELQVDIARLRALLAEGRAAMAEQMETAALEGSAWTYAGFSDADLQDYAAALEAPLMRKVYGLMNAVQFEIMVKRFETLAARMAELRPGRDL